MLTGSYPNLLVAIRELIYCIGLTFFLLGALKLGVLIGFFPRHILIGRSTIYVLGFATITRFTGCIGGVGVFLITTGYVITMIDRFFFLTQSCFQNHCQHTNGGWWFRPHLWNVPLLISWSAQFHIMVPFLYFGGSSSSYYPQVSQSTHIPSLWVETSYLSLAYFDILHRLHCHPFRFLFCSVSGAIQHSGSERVRMDIHYRRRSRSLVQVLHDVWFVNGFSTCFYAMYLPAYQTWKPFNGAPSGPPCRLN